MSDEKFGRFEVSTELWEIPKPENPASPPFIEILEGYEVFFLSDGKMVEEPITDEAALVDGVEVGVCSFFGYVRATVKRKQSGVWAENENSIYPLNFANDYRGCWTCSESINRKCFGAVVNQFSPGKIL